MSVAKSRVSYSKEHREQAKRDGTNLVTVDIPGMRFQTAAATEDQVSDLYDLLNLWFKKHLFSENTQKE